MNEGRMVKKGFTIVEVSLIIIVIVISASITLPYLFGTTSRTLKEQCRKQQHTIFFKTRECIHKYSESQRMLRELESGEVCEFLLKKRIAKSRDIFQCPSSSTGAQKPNDYEIVFDSLGKLIGIECTVDASHNYR